MFIKVTLSVLSSTEDLTALANEDDPRLFRETEPILFNLNNVVSITKSKPRRTKSEGVHPWVFRDCVLILDSTHRQHVAYANFDSLIRDVIALGHELVMDYT